MPNLTLEKKWTRWYPKKISFKNKEKNKKFLYFSSQLTQEDFFIDQNNKGKKDDSQTYQKSEIIDLTTTKEYKIGFKKGFLEASQDNIILKKN